MGATTTPLREAAESLAVAAQQLFLATRRALAAGHPNAPALERLAVSVLGVATKGVLEVAAFVRDECARSEREAADR